MTKPFRRRTSGMTEFFCMFHRREWTLIRIMKSTLRVWRWGNARWASGNRWDYGPIKCGLEDSGVVCVQLETVKSSFLHCILFGDFKSPSHFVMEWLYPCSSDADAWISGIQQAPEVHWSSSRMLSHHESTGAQAWRQASHFDASRKSWGAPGAHLIPRGIGIFGSRACNHTLLEICLFFSRRSKLLIPRSWSISYVALIFRGQICFLFAGTGGLAGGDPRHRKGSAPGS